MPISTVIAKPTTLCNADCTYCSTPPESSIRWSVEDFSRYLDRLSPILGKQVTWVWHGGEPMLMGPEFYLACFDIAQAHEGKTGQRIVFSMQSNLLLYDTARWASVIRDVFGGSLSTSFDPDERYRTLKGSTLRYTDRFFNRLERVLSDGFRPMLIGTFDENSSVLADKFYELSASRPQGERFPIRLNYRYPVGRASDDGESITPRSYGAMLVSLFNRWMHEQPGFMVTPLDQMLKLVLGLESERCPWTSKCGSRIVEIGTGGDIHTCGEFADLHDPAYTYGNINRSEARVLLFSKAAVDIRRRMGKMPQDCFSCRHFEVCGGGCMRDSILYQHGIYGKFHYCESWQMVFDRIKEAVQTGEAKPLIRHLGLERI